MSRICIITPDYLASTPRVVKEATALAAAGHSVRVVHSRGAMEHWRRFDAALQLPAGIDRRILNWSPDHHGERSLYHLSRWRHRLWRSAPLWLRRLPGVAERVLGRLYPELARAAASQPADLYIGHYPSGLAAAACAARHHQALLGFDSEDLHAQESPPATARTTAWVQALERRLLPRCAHVSAASAPMAQALQQHYGIALPVTVRNTFPEPLPTLTARERGDETLALYWFSQTIGPGRGLEWALAALARVHGDVRLYLRGQVSSAEQMRLQALATALGCTERLVLLPPVAPDHLHSSNRQFDVGLALELADTRSRDLTVTNKLYQYLQAGLAPVASATQGQMDLLQQIELDACCVATQDVAALASLLQRLHDQPQWLAQLRAKASQAAIGPLAHQHDQQVLTDAVQRALTRHGRT